MFCQPRKIPSVHYSMKIECHLQGRVKYLIYLYVLAKINIISNRLPLLSCITFKIPFDSHLTVLANARDAGSTKCFSLIHSSLCWLLCSYHALRSEIDMLTAVYIYDHATCAVNPLHQMCSVGSDQ